MRYLILAFFSFLMTVPDVQMKLNRENESLSIKIVGRDELLGQCIKSGFVLKYNFEAQLCSKRLLWFDHCEEKRLIRHALSYDSITDRYRLDTEYVGHYQSKDSEYYDSLPEAQRALAQLKELPLEYVVPKSSASLYDENAYFDVKVTSECSEGKVHILQDLSYILTLGMYRVTGFDTGWISFNFKPLVNPLVAEE